METVELDEEVAAADEFCAVFRRIARWIKRELPLAGRRIHVPKANNAKPRRRMVQDSLILAATWD